MTAPRRATIRDVAAAAGVSKSLVSLVYSGGRVSDDRRARVLAAAESLGFRPNYAARSLAASDGGFTGILVSDLHNPVFAEIVDAARAELAALGRSALLTVATAPAGKGEPALDWRTLHTLADLGPRSLLVAGTVPGIERIGEIMPGVPIVMASAIADAAGPSATVRADDEEGMRLVVAHLASRGHRRIAYVGGLGGPVAERRAQAYRTAMAAHGLGSEAHVRPADFTERAGHAAALALWGDASPPTAVACVNDMAALGVMATVPEGDRVAVVGYDNSHVAGLRAVSLTSVDPQSAVIGRRAARMAADAEDGAGPVREQLVAPRLVVRHSTD